MSRSRSLAGALQSGVVINEDSADVDFRVESNGNANMLFVNGGTDKIGIGVTDPDATLDVSGGENKLGILRVTQRLNGAAAFGLDVGLHSSNGDPVFSTIVNDSLTEAIRINRATAAVTMPAQPSFSVTPSSTQSNFAVGSHVTVVFDTEIFDVGGNFASNTFTAPVTGKYQLNMRVDLQNTDTAAGFYQYRIATSNRVYATSFDPDHMDSDTVFYGVNLSQLVDMDASDTATVSIFQSSGTQQSDIGGGSAFNGILVG